MNYSFLLDDAKKHGLHQAILISLHKHFDILFPKEDFILVKGEKWFCGSVIKIQRIMPFLSKKQVASMLRKLVLSGVLKKARLNKDHFNRTYWYSFDV